MTEFVDPAYGGLDRIIPLSVLKRAQGFAIFTVARLGFLVSARAGSGVVIARLPDDSWSAPSALGLGGLGGGFNAGVEVTDFLIVLNNKQAVRSFMATGSLQLGGNLSLAVGPLGRAAEASGAINSSGNLAAMYSYSKSKGLYGGVSVEGTVLLDRSDANAKAYHRSVTAKQLLNGSVDPPSFAQPLIDTIEKFTLSGNVGAGIQEGQRRDTDGCNFDEEDDKSIDSLDREMKSAHLSPSLSSRRDKNAFVDDFESRRPGEYAFGGNGTGGGSSYQTNSPTRTRKSFLGNAYQTSKGTDYQRDIDTNGNSYEAMTKSNNGKAKPRFNRNKSSGAASGSIFGDEAAINTPWSEKSSYIYDTNARGLTKNQTRTSSSTFATRFDNDEDDTDEDAKNLNLVSKDINGLRAPSHGTRDSYEEAEDLRRKPHSALTRSGNNDLLDFELDRSAVTQRQAPRSREKVKEKNLIDFDVDSSNGRGGNTFFRKTGGSGMDELDRELQIRKSSSSSNDSLPYQNNGNGATAAAAWPDYSSPSRPKMHSRTSSAQKIFNRLRGNSQSSKNAFANLDTWEPRNSSSSRRSPSPATLMGSSTTTPPLHAFKSSTPTGFRSSSSTGFKSTTPTGFRSSSSTGFKSTTPTGFKSSGSGSSTPAPMDFSAYQDTIQVIASYDFEGQEYDDLSFKRGDVINVVKKTANRDDWWIGKVGSRVGNFPANWTDDV